MVIAVQGLSKTFATKQRKGFWKNLFSPTYKQLKAVDNISFLIKEGELVGFIGPNGAGKSTTIKMLTGILHPSKGKINVLGYSPQQQRKQLAYHIGTIFGQRQQLWYHLPASDTFDLFAKIYEIDDREYRQRLNELVKLFEIQPFLDTPVRKLSLGQRMRCEFVASLLHKPKVLFLDEPTIGLDMLAKRSMRTFIKKVNQEEKTTIILTSHDLEDIEELCQRVIVINHGKILYDNSMDNLKKKLKYKRLEIVFEEPPKELPKHKHMKIIEKLPYKVTLQVVRQHVKTVLDMYLSCCNIADIVIEDPPIEQVIERLYT